jgi:hypothetical protein
VFFFKYAEHSHEISTGNNWTGNSYDGASRSIGSLGYVNTSDSPIQTMDMLSLRF